MPDPHEDQPLSKENVADHFPDVNPAMVATAWDVLTDEQYTISLSAMQWAEVLGTLMTSIKIANSVGSIFAEQKIEPLRKEIEIQLNAQVIARGIEVFGTAKPSDL